MNYFNSLNEESAIDIIKLTYNLRLFRFLRTLEYARSCNATSGIFGNESQINNCVINALSNIELIKKDALKNNIDLLEYSIDELRLEVKRIFKDDKFGTMRQAYLIDLLLDNTYNYDQKFANKIFEDISYIFGEEKTYLTSLKKRLGSDFMSMFSNPNKGIKPALIVSGVSALLILALVPSLIGGLQSSASVFTHTLKSIFGLGIQESVLALSCLVVGAPAILGLTTYSAIQIKDRLEIRKQFKKLSNDDAALNLLKMVYALRKLDAYRKNNYEAQIMFDSILEGFIDLRNDCFVESIESRSSPLKARLKLFSAAEKILSLSLGV